MLHCRHRTLAHAGRHLGTQPGQVWAGSGTWRYALPPASSPISRWVPSASVRSPSKPGEEERETLASVPQEGLLCSLPRSPQPRRPEAVRCLQSASHQPHLPAQVRPVSSCSAGKKYGSALSDKKALEKMAYNIALRCSCGSRRKHSVFMQQRVHRSQW